MWSRQAETYVAMLQYQSSGMVEGYIETASAQEWAVRDLWQQSALAGVLALEDAREKDPELRRLRHAIAQASKRLTVQIRVELDHRRRQQCRQGRSQGSLPTSFINNPAGKLPPAGPESMTKPLPETPPGQLR
jgi:hypothetical protein